MKRLFLNIIVLLILIPSIYAQEEEFRKIDSLKQLVWQEPDDEKRLVLLNKLTKKLKYPLDTAEYYLRLMLKESERLKQNASYAVALNRMTELFLRSKPMDSSMFYAKKVIRFSDSVNDLVAKARGYVNLSLLYYIHDHYEDAIKINKKGLDIFLNVLKENLLHNEDSIRVIHKSITLFYNHLASCYSEKNMPDSVIFYRKKAIELADSLNLPKYKLLNKYKIGYYYVFKLNSHKKGLKYLLEAYSKAEKNHYDWLAIQSAYAISNAYFYLNNLDSSFYYLKRASAGFKLLNDYSHLSSAYYSIATLLYKKKTI